MKEVNTDIVLQENIPQNITGSKAKSLKQKIVGYTHERGMTKEKTMVLIHRKEATYKLDKNEKNSLKSTTYQN